MLSCINHIFSNESIGYIFKKVGGKVNAYIILLVSNHPLEEFYQFTSPSAGSPRSYILKKLFNDAGSRWPCGDEYRLPWPLPCKPGTLLTFAEPGAGVQMKDHVLYF